MKTRIAVLVSGGGTNLQALIGGETAVCLRGKGEPREAFEARLQRILAGNHIDMVILAGFMAILSAEFVKHWPERIINVHPALIPSFCGEGFYGLRVHRAALDYGVKVTGATVHYVNEIPDGGRIIAQKAVEIAEDDTPETLQRRVMEQAEWILLPRAAEMVAEKIAQNNH